MNYPLNAAQQRSALDYRASFEALFGRRYFLTADEVSEYVRIPLQELMADGEVPSVEVEGEAVIPVAALSEFMASRTTGQAETMSDSDWAEVRRVLGGSFWDDIKLTTS